ILTDALGCRENACRSDGVDVSGPHEKMVVFSRDRPVRCEAELNTSADRAAPAGLTDLGGESAAWDGEGCVMVAGDGRAALGVKQDGVPGIADLTGEQTEGIDP